MVRFDVAISPCDELMIMYEDVSTIVSHEIVIDPLNLRLVPHYKTNTRQHRSKTGNYPYDLGCHVDVSGVIHGIGILFWIVRIFFVPNILLKAAHVHQKTNHGKNSR